MSETLRDTERALYHKATYAQGPALIGSIMKLKIEPPQAVTSSEKIFQTPVLDTYNVRQRYGSEGSIAKPALLCRASKQCSLSACYIIRISP